MRELQARLRLAESARTRDPEYGGDFSGEDEDAVLANALGAAIRAIALEDGTGTAPSSVRTPAAAETEARAALRRSTRFAAAPVPDSDALASLGVAPIAERALTRPESPPLRTNRRASRWG